MLKNELGAERLACVGKHVRGRLTLVSLALLPALYALTGRAGRRDDFRDAELTPLERELAETLLAHGPQTAPDLRALLGFVKAKEAKRALERLQRLLIATHAGEQPQEQGWDAVVFDLLARRHQQRLRRLPTREEACVELAAAVLRAGEQLSAADLAAALGIARAEAVAALDRLVDEGTAVQYEEAALTLWSATSGSRRGRRSRESRRAVMNSARVL